jgi:hypothetical protein
VLTPAGVASHLGPAVSLPGEISRNLEKCQGVKAVFGSYFNRFRHHHHHHRHHHNGGYGSGGWGGGGYGGGGNSWGGGGGWGGGNQQGW